MHDNLKIQLQPLGKTLEAKPGTPLSELLFSAGVEFPCGGRGRCRGCRVKVLYGDLPITPEDQRLFSEQELASGWRMACRAAATADLILELAQWEVQVLSDDTAFEFRPRPGYGIAVDLGTTTVVAQLMNLSTGQVLGVKTALNAQARHGADIMSRVQFGLSGVGLSQLAALIRDQIGGMIIELLATSTEAETQLKDVVVVGNSVMHHLFCSLDPKSLSHYPFELVNGELQQFGARELGWQLTANPTVRFLPCLGGFVGSDILAGILATGMHRRTTLEVLLDLGTNGEMVVGNAEKLLCASTAAGPAFEGARISMGMRAATGAISEVILHDGQLVCHVLGQTEPRGICGSGLVDAVAAGLDSNRVTPSGRFTPNGQPWMLQPPVQLTQADVRELQLAKGAIAAGLRILLEQWGASLSDVRRVHLAGAFGNYIRRSSARRIGLFAFDPAIVEPAGNTALRGAKIALFNASDYHFAELRSRCRQVSLSADPHFQDIYCDEMFFPESAGIE
jgi:uncharacterized 2Fe-2S/4Fe-4S cluster protein (DUF4445 family)